MLLLFPQLILVPFLIRTIGESGYGVYALVWPLLMFIFVIKTADIGAYTFGMLFGKHKFSPKISPGKTWSKAVFTKSPADKVGGSIRGKCSKQSKEYPVSTVIQTSQCHQIA